MYVVAIALAFGGVSFAKTRPPASRLLQFVADAASAKAVRNTIALN
jgi:hypothetical protein